MYKVRLSARGKEGKVSDVSPMPCGRLRFAKVVTYDSSKLLVTGGESQDHYREARTWRLDFRASRSWSQCPTLTTTRCRHTTFQLANQLYFYGGLGEGRWLSIIEALSLTDTQPRWTRLREKPPEMVNIEFPALSHVNILNSHLSALNTTGIHL